MLVCVSLPKPEDPNLVCYLSMFTSEVHAQTKDEILVDFPVGLDWREERWIPAKFATPL